MREVAGKVQELIPVQEKDVLVGVAPTEAAVIVDEPLAVVVQGPRGGVEQLPVQQAMVLNVRWLVAAGRVRVAAAARRQDEVSHNRVCMDARHAQVCMILHPVCAQSHLQGDTTASMQHSHRL